MEVLRGVWDFQLLPGKFRTKGLLAQNFIKTVIFKNFIILKSVSIEIVKESNKERSLVL